MITHLLLGGLAGCIYQSASESLEGSYDAGDYTGPGSDAWVDEDVSCDSSSDCLTGEACIDSVCQVEKCTDNLDDSVPPLGKGLTFYKEKEIVVADTVSYQGGYWLDGYAPDRSMDYEYSWNLGSQRIQDIAAGDFYGLRPEFNAVVISGQRDVQILGNSTDEIDPGFAPSAIAAGDVDGDGLDELVAVGSSSFSVCDVDEDRCETWEFGSSYDLFEVTVADIDGDRFEEPVMLLEYDGYVYMYAFNWDSEFTGQVPDWSAYLGGEGTNPMRIAGADLDGDLIAEIVGIWDEGWYDYYDDSVLLWSAYEDSEGGTFQQVSSATISGHGVVLDIATADIDLDDTSEIFILADDGEVVEMSWNGSFARGASRDLGYSSDPDRITLADFDGDSPKAYLEGDSEKCEGNVLPMMVMIPPPFDRDHSDGDGSVGYGSSESTSESYSDTVSLGLGVDVGVGGSFFDLFSAKYSTKVGWGTSTTYGTSVSYRVGERYGLNIDPDLYGPNYGGVVLTWGCFDAYTYTIDDPKGYLGGDGEEFILIAPTGGGTSLWSTARYNAMAEALGTLPQIEVPYIVGDVSSYPREATKLDGSSMSSSEMLFRDPNTYTVSDVGDISWWNSVSESETNSSSESFDLGASAGITVAGVSVGGSVSMGWSSSYSLSVGSDASFMGSVPPLPDDPSTPEDEYQLYNYEVTPYVYLQEYEDFSGNEAAFYVMTYSVKTQD